MKERKERSNVSRRGFLKGSTALIGVSTLGLLGGCSPKTAGGGKDETAENVPATKESSKPSFMTAPSPIDSSKITETMEADIVVVGCGLAGLCAARSAAESGASVIVIEKSESYNCRSGQFGIYGSKIQQENGMDYDVNAAIANEMELMGYRADQRIWNLWRDYSGEAFDWYLSPANGDVTFLPIDAKEYGDTRINVLALHYPAPTGYNPADEFFPSYPEGSFALVPSQRDTMQLNYETALAEGVEFHFATWARQLERQDDGRVIGVVAQNIDDDYLEFKARKGVILAAGGYGHNAEMVQYYTGEALECPIWPDVDAKGEFTNMGEGQQMGIWIGAKMESGPHIQGNHSLGGPLGVDGFFMCDALGRRFMNEDIGGQQMTNQLMRHPKQICWTVFDDKYPEQVEYMGCSHGTVNHVVPDEDLPALEGAATTIGRHALTSRKEVESTAIKADSLEELAAAMGFAEKETATFLEQVKRYNELCAKGVDEDYGKTPSRMFPIETPPFYAGQIAPGIMLECMGGLVIDSDSLLVVDESANPIEGLYAVGNNMGGRFLVDYPTTIAGMSHSMCLVFGYLAGKKAAQNQ